MKRLTHHYLLVSALELPWKACRKQLPLALLLGLLAGAAPASHAQTVLINETFDSMGPSGTTFPVGWTAGYLAGNPSRVVMPPYAGDGLAITAMPVVVSDGSALPTPNVGTVLNLGVTDAADRALGNYPRTTTSGDHVMQVAVQNNSGGPVSEVTLSYWGEQWRQSQGTSTSGPEILRVLASTTSDISGFTYLPTLDFTAPKQLAVDWPVGGLDGNDAANRVFVTGTITFDSPVPNGGLFYVRWHDWNDNGTSDHLLAIDNVQIVVPAPVIQTNWIAYNDHAGSAATAANATRYSMMGRTVAESPAVGGLLKDFASGFEVAAGMVSTATGTPDYFGASAYPTAGTPAYNLFNGIVDVGNNNSMIGVRQSAGSTATITFTNLDPAQRYFFRGTAVRGNNYLDRWTLCTLQGAISYTNAHSPVGTYTAANFPTGGMTADQVAFDSGENRADGALVGWDNIDPGPDGSFSVLSQQYAPTTLPNGLAPNLGAYGYGLNAISLSEVGTPPGLLITQHPQNQPLYVGLTATFTVAAQSAKPITYQWQKASPGSSTFTDVPGATTNRYTTLPAVAADDGSRYRCKVAIVGLTLPSLAGTWVRGPYTVLTAALAVTNVDLSKPGFRVWPYQTDGADPSGQQPNTIAWTEDQLLGLHGANIADLSGADASGSYTNLTVINYNIEAGTTERGNFTNDVFFPGIPGTTALTGNSSMEALTFLHFPAAGVYRIGVNSDDGFRVTAGKNPRDRLAPILGEYNGGRGSADTLFDVVVEQAGYYPCRLLWENGNGELTGNSASCEWFTLAADGTKVLINDLANPNAIKAYHAGPLSTYVKWLNPLSGAVNVPVATTIDFLLADGTASTVVSNSIKLWLDGVRVTPTISRSPGTNVTTVSFDPPGDLVPGAIYTVRLEFGDDATPADSRGGQYQFTTAPTLASLVLIDDATLWSYNDSGTDLGTAWRATSYPAESGWATGAALIGVETITVEPLRTDLSGAYVQATITYYFRHHFSYSGPAGAQLRLRHVLDDGGVFYLNGTEIHRFGLAAGAALTYQTLFTSHENVWEGPFSITSVSPVAGDNVLAVEVHQTANNSSDIVFGAELSAITSPTPRPVISGTSLVGGSLSFRWSGGGTLQEASIVTGPYTDAADQSNPHLVSATGPAKFYRIKQ